MTPDLSAIGETIRLLRTVQGLTLRDLATQTGLSPAYLSDIEHGRSVPSLKTLCAVADAFDMGAADVLAEAGFSRVYNARALRENMAIRWAYLALQQAIRNVIVKDQKR